MIDPPRTEVQRLLLGLLFTNSKRAWGPPQDPRANRAAERKGCLGLPIATAKLKPTVRGIIYLPVTLLGVVQIQWGVVTLDKIHQDLSSTGALTPQRQMRRPNLRPQERFVCLEFKKQSSQTHEGEDFKP